MGSGYSHNRHVIDEALSEFAAGLRPFVVEMTSATVEADPSALIRLMLHRWEDAFHDVLGYRGKNLLYEIRDIRNDWAHNSRRFDDDDTDRALDSIERFLSAIGATSEAGALKQTKEDRRRVRFIDPTRQTPTADASEQRAIPRRDRPDKWDDFGQYLRDIRTMKESVIRSRVGNCKRIERFEGKLDAHFDADECQDLLTRLTYTARDQDLRRRPKHNVPINGDLRTGSATLKQAVTLYVRFRQHRRDEL